MKTSLKVGGTVGVIIGIICIVIYYMNSFFSETEFTKLNPVSILVVSIIVNVVGAALYAKLEKTVNRPVLMYGLIAFGIAIALSALDWAYPPEPKIADVAIPIHMTVATLSTSMIPRWLYRSERTFAC